MSHTFLSNDAADADSLLDDDASDVLEALWQASAADELGAAYAESLATGEATHITEQLEPLAAAHVPIGKLLEDPRPQDGAGHVLRELRQWFKLQLSEAQHRLLPRRVCWLLYLATVAAALRYDVLDPVRNGPMSKSPRQQIGQQLHKASAEQWIPETIRRQLSAHATALSAEI
ncbi:MAG: hypothetical protein AAGI46_01505 [Planctomycetota bacterium]